MNSKILIFDTSVLCCYLRVLGKEEAGPKNNRWNYARISQLLDHEQKHGSIFVLPLATIIETGNHIAQSPGQRFERASELADLLRAVADGTTPWAAFTEQSMLWQPENLCELAATWPPLAAAGISIGDVTIKDVAEFYASAGFKVEILTGDRGLKAYEPISPPLIPRRRQ
jgi:hypothetical protein